MEGSLENDFSVRALEDFMLIDMAVSGDEKAYAKLFLLYKHTVYKIILKMVRNVDDAEDLVIESFTKAFRGLPHFKKERNFSTWLFRIATNGTIDFMRKKKLQQISMDSSYSDSEGNCVTMDLADSDLNPQDQTIAIQKEKYIQEFVNMLPSRYRQLVRLRYFRELAYEEIAEMLDVPMGTVKAQLHRARELMYDMVKSMEKSI